MPYRPEWAPIWAHGSGAWYGHDAYVNALARGLSPDEFTACDEHGSPLPDPEATAAPAEASVSEAADPAEAVDAAGASAPADGKRRGRGK